MKLSAKQTASLAVRALLIVAVVFTADRVVKQWCIEVLRAQGSIAFWPGVLHFTYAENTGAAFSILSGRRLLLTLLPIAALGLLLFLYFRRLYAHPLTDFALPLIMGGALGNLYDRIAYGYVVDFLEIRLFRFAIFNLADCAISVGSALLILYLVLHWKELSSEVDQGKDEGQGKDENSPLPEEPCKKEGQEAFPAACDAPSPAAGQEDCRMRQPSGETVCGAFPQDGRSQGADPACGIGRDQDAAPQGSGPIPDTGGDAGPPDDTASAHGESLA